jgi:hypothetical protein
MRLRAPAAVVALPGPDLRRDHAFAFAIYDQRLPCPRKASDPGGQAFGKVVLAERIDRSEVVARGDTMDDPDSALGQDLGIGQHGIVREARLVSSTDQPRTGAGSPLVRGLPFGPRPSDLHSLQGIVESGEYGREELSDHQPD